MALRHLTEKAAARAWFDQCESDLAAATDREAIIAAAGRRRWRGMASGK